MNQNQETKQNIIFHIDGGLGKNIMATAVISAMKKKYVDYNIIVVSGYPDVFADNPNVKKTLHFSQASSVYNEYILGKEAKVFTNDPYQTSDFITEKSHLLSIWCNLLGFEYNNEMPEIFLSQAEKEHFEPLYKTSKPIFAIHPNGGAENQALKYSWTRDLPAIIVNEVVEEFKNQYSIVHVKRADQTQYADTIGALDNWRSIAIMLSLSKKRLLIDSSSMHLATALNLPSVVTWIGTNPKVLGYDMHTNIIANEPTKEINTEHNFYAKYLFYEDISRFPYNSLNEVLNVDQIIKALKK